MAGAKLDGAGLAKMGTLDNAILLLQRVNGARGLNRAFDAFAFHSSDARKAFGPR